MYKKLPCLLVTYCNYFRIKLFLHFHQLPIPDYTDCISGLQPKNRALDTATSFAQNMGADSRFYTVMVKEFPDGLNI